MINKEVKLASNIFSGQVEKLSLRQGFGEGLLAAGKENSDVVVLTADLKESTFCHFFAKEFPERFFDCGVAEQGMITIASGLAHAGKIPFAASYAVFSPGRNWEQIRTTIALNDVPVKIVGSHTGLNVGPDGATHQMLEDIALMRVLPNMVVLVPMDSQEAKKATLAATQNGKPTYLRLTREKFPVMTTPETPFQIGKANVLWKDRDPQVGIVACGPLVYEALLAAQELGKLGVETLVVNCHTIKPIDEDLIVKVARMTGALVTAEEHQVSGGLGGAVAEILAQKQPVPIEFVGVRDSFGESGTAEELLTKYGLKAKNIIEAARMAIARKNA